MARCTYRDWRPQLRPADRPRWQRTGKAAVAFARAVSALRSPAGLPVEFSGSAQAIDFAFERQRAGDTPRALYEACLARVHPIMMTTFAALLGAVLLVLGSGYGSEFRRPLGIRDHRWPAGRQLLTLHTLPAGCPTSERMGRTNLGTRVERRSASPRSLCNKM
ncbi:hypothetical protein G3N57_00080 [Paraburkholderia sp. Se-20369]|nr:hypothetical protein [Paraburkholderia sp. Se-20369]